MTINPRVAEICAEYGIRLIEANKYPDIGETRAVAALERIYAKHGPEHFHMLMETITQTANKKACLTGAFIWATNDLLLECGYLISGVKDGVSRWFSAFDAAPADQMVWISQGMKDKRAMIKGMMLERVRAAFEDQKDLFRRAA